MKHLFTFLLFLFVAQTQAQETLINETFETGWTADSNVIPAENEETQETEKENDDKDEEEELLMQAIASSLAD